MPLTPLLCRKALCPPDQKLKKLGDGGGLYLLVTAKGAKHWRLKFRADGRENVLALGSYPEVTLAQAREKRDEQRKLLADGKDPAAVRRDAKLQRAIDRQNTFEAVARQWWEFWRQSRTPRHAGYALRRMELDVFPAIGRVPVRDLTTKRVADLAKRVEQRGALDISRRVLQMVGQVLRYAVANDLVERNVAAEVRPSDFLQSRRGENFARLDEKELPELLRKVEAYTGGPYTRLAMKLMALTFVRTGELIGARWEEFDLAAAQWRIPAARMKMRTPHIVPLAPQAVEALQALHTISGHRALLFPGERDHAKPMSNNTILMALRRMGYQGRMTGHGWRGVASTILHERGFKHEWIELQLAHQKRDAISAAYDHATYLAERTRMMAWWADHLDKLRRGADVVELRARGA